MQEASSFTLPRNWYLVKQGVAHARTALRSRPVGGSPGSSEGWSPVCGLENLAHAALCGGHQHCGVAAGLHLLLVSAAL